MKNELKTNKLKMTKERIIYCILLAIIPIAILLIANIFPKMGKDATAGDKVNLLFLTITMIMYMVAVFLSSKILVINKEFILINKYIKENKNLNNDDKFELINNKIKGKESESFENINSAYSSYIKSLRGIAEDNEYGESKKRLYSTTDANYFFDEENIIEKNILHKTVNILTQSLTGVGIFGTFLGIVQGLAGLDMSNTDTMKDGIQGLLSGVSISFSTSLYGILFSLIITLSLKIVIEKTMKDCEVFGDVLNDIIPTSSEKEGLKELEVELKKQTSSLDKLATNLAEQIDKKFDESMQRNLDRLSQDLGAFISKIEERFTNSIGENNAATALALSSIGPTMEKLEYVINNMQEQQEKSSLKFIEESMQAMKEAINVGTNDEIDKLRSSMEIISSKNAEMVETFTNSMENMKMLTVHQENLIKNTTDSTQSMNMTTENIKDLQESLSIVISSLNDVSKNNNVSLENVQNTIESMKVAMSNQVDIVKSIEGMIEKSCILSENQQNYIDKLDRMSNSIDSSIENSKNHISSITNELGVYKNQFININKSTMDVVNSLDNRYKDMVKDISLVNDNLNNTVRSVDSNILNKVNEIGNELKVLIKELNNYQTKNAILTDKISRFADVEESTQKLWVNYKGSFDNLNTTITEGVENYNKHINEGVTEVLRNFDEHISKAVDSLKQVADSLGDTAESISENLDEIGAIVKA